MSPNNINSDTAKFFADLTYTYNLGTTKRPSNKKGDKQKGNFTILRGSIGGRLSKLKNKGEPYQNMDRSKMEQI